MLVSETPPFNNKVMGMNSEYSNPSNSTEENSTVRSVIKVENDQLTCVLLKRLDKITNIIIILSLSLVLLLKTWVEIMLLF